MARKKIKKVSVAPIDPIEGAVSDTLNVTDKVKNAPSINLVQNMTGIPQNGVIYYDGEAIPEGYEEVEDPNRIVQIPWTDIMYMKDGFSCLEAYVFKDRNRYFGNIVVFSSAGFLNSTVIGFLKQMMGVWNTGCFLTHNQWNAQAVGYCYMGDTQIIVSDSSGQNWTVAKINFELIANE